MKFVILTPAYNSQPTSLAIKLRSIQYITDTGTSREVRYLVGKGKHAKLKSIAISEQLDYILDLLVSV